MEGLMENRFLIEVTNDSEHEFVFDGDWFRAGDWKSSTAVPIPAQSMSVIELQSEGFKGVAGIAWWTDSKNHDVYLSMAFQNPRLQPPQFTCFAGLPPPDLKSELDLAPRLVQGKRQSPEGAGCAWVAATVGNLTTVKLHISADLLQYVPPSANSYDATTASSAGGSSSSSSAPAAAAAPPDASPNREPSTSTAIVATGQVEDVQSEEQAKEALGKFMAQTRPKDAMDGVQRGLKTAGTSIVAGFGNVIASTVGGYQSNGGIGVAKGLCTGIIGGAAITVGGTVCGVAQIGRGIANTPQALRGRREQRVWDQELGQWVDIDLCALEAQVEAEGSDDESTPNSGGGATSSGSGSGAVVDTEYYDLLRVQPSATASEIKKAYYREARQCHPDKNPGDAEAKAKFQRMADAYQVLSDPQSRKKYDRDGKEGIQEGNVKMDPSVFFSLLFGSELFEPWLGELHLAMQTDEFAKTLEKEVDERSIEDTMQDTEVANKSLKRRQTRREVRCACHLRDKLERFVYGRDIAGWEEQLRLEAVGLASGQFGPQILTTLGEIYQLRADIYLADELVGRYSLKKRIGSAKHWGVTMKHRWTFYQTAAGSLLRAKRVHDAAKVAAAKAAAKEKEPDAAKTATEAENGNTGEKSTEAGNPSEQGAESTSADAEEEQRKAVEEALDHALPQFLQTAWAAVVTDIDGTIKEVGRKLLKDKSVCWQIRLRRAQALRRLGEIFVEEGAKAQAEQGDAAVSALTSEAAKATLQEALMGSVREKR